MNTVTKIHHDSALDSPADTNRLPVDAERPPASLGDAAHDDGCA